MDGRTILEEGLQNRWGTFFGGMRLALRMPIRGRFD